jgi:hypothetical protein
MRANLKPACEATFSMDRTGVTHVDEASAGQEPEGRGRPTREANPRHARRLLPPTSPELAAPECRPYFLWWTDTSTLEFQRHLRDPDPERRAYWLGALLREANTRDVWLFTTPQTIRELWPHLLRHLGRSRAMWAYLLDIDDPAWPPANCDTHRSA